MSNILEKFFLVQLAAAAFFIFEKNLIIFDFFNIWLQRENIKNRFLREILLIHSARFYCDLENFLTNIRKFFNFWHCIHD